MKHQEAEYSELKGRIAEMSSMATGMVKDSIQALVERDSDLARDVIQRDDRMDELDVEIDEQCVRLLALYEPKASDLRFIMAGNRIIVDLERIGDHCVNICKQIIRINELPQVKPYVDLPRMAEITAGMVEDAVHCYVDRNTSRALSVLQRDDTVDQLHNQILRELITYLAEDVKHTKAIFGLLMVAQGVERIADYATNIAEDVYFMVTAEVIRHKPLEDIGDETHPDH